MVKKSIVFDTCMHNIIVIYSNKPSDTYCTQEAIIIGAQQCRPLVLRVRPGDVAFDVGQQIFQRFNPTTADGIDGSRISHFGLVVVECNSHL